MSRRASGGTLAAFLIFAAIVGFAGGAYLGTQSGEGANAAPPGESDSTTPAGNDGGGTDNDPPDQEPDETEPPADGDLTLSLAKTSASPDERIDYTGKLGSGEEGVSLQIQRSIDGGDWEDFPVTTDTGANGEFSGYLKTGRPGENSFRVVRADDDSVVSEPATISIG